MSFSDLVHKVEADVEHVLLPQGLPSDTREAEALAKKAEGVVLAVDPELSPLFDRIGVLGDYVEQAMTELGTVTGTVKKIIATRAQQVPPPETPPAVPSEPSAPPASSEPSTEPSTGATSSVPPEDPTGDPSSATSPGASMSDAIPPAESLPPQGSTLPAPAPADIPTGSPAPTSEGADPAPQPAIDPELEAEETGFGALSPEDQAAFETAEGLEPIATAQAASDAAAADVGQTGSTPPPPA